MDLYLIRHAEAIQLGEQGITEDEVRPLTEAGANQARNLARGLQKRRVTLDLVLTSPLVRARQTAEEMLRAWSQPVPDLRVCDELQPKVKARKLARFLRGQQANAIALVGHEPALSRHTAWFIGSKKAQIELGKAGVACITLAGKPDKGSGALVWLVTQVWLGE